MWGGGSGGGGAALAGQASDSEPAGARGAGRAAGRGVGAGAELAERASDAGPTGARGGAGRPLRPGPAGSIPTPRLHPDPAGRESRPAPTVEAPRAQSPIHRGLERSSLESSLPREGVPALGPRPRPASSLIQFQFFGKEGGGARVCRVALQREEPQQARGARKDRPQGLLLTRARVPLSDRRVIQGPTFPDHLSPHKIDDPPHRRSGF